LLKLISIIISIITQLYGSLKDKQASIGLGKKCTTGATEKDMQSLSHLKKKKMALRN